MTESVKKYVTKYGRQSVSKQENYIMVNYGYACMCVRTRALCVRAVLPIHYLVYVGQILLLKQREDLSRVDVQFVVPIYYGCL